MSRCSAASVDRLSLLPADLAYLPVASLVDCLPPALALKQQSGSSGAAGKVLWTAVPSERLELPGYEVKWVRDDWLGLSSGCCGRLHCASVTDKMTGMRHMTASGNRAVECVAFNCC